SLGSPARAHQQGVRGWACGQTPAPAPLRTSLVSPLGALPNRTRTPAAGESSVDRQAGRAPSAPHATQSGEGAGREQGETSSRYLTVTCNTHCCLAWLSCVVSLATCAQRRGCRTLLRGFPNRPSRGLHPRAP